MITDTSKDGFRVIEHILGSIVAQTVLFKKRVGIAFLFMVSVGLVWSYANQRSAFGEVRGHLGCHCHC